MSGEPWTQARIEETMRMLRETGSTAETARQMGITTAALRSAFASRRLPPPHTFTRRSSLPYPALPDGYAVRRVSTTTDASGETVAQSIASAPAGEYAATVAPVPEGHDVRGVSTLLGADGEVRAQWIKTSAADTAHRAWLDALPALLDPVRGAVEPAPPVDAESDDLVVYVIGDAHIGMLSWAPETGASWDVARAEAMTAAASDKLFSATPSTRRALVVNVGDFQHADSPSNATPEGGNRLDVDGRDTKVRRAVMRTIRRYIGRALVKHDLVEYINQPGNHDPYATAWLGLALEALYEREPRVRIDTSPAEHRVVEHGQVMIGVTHKPRQGEDLGHLLAAKWPEIWGRTTYRTWLCGHVHHESRKERAGFLVETFGTLAPADAWHARQGYMARRRMSAIVYSPTSGEVGRHTVYASELE